MASRNATIADAVRDDLNAAAAANAFPMSFEARRVYLPIYELDQLTQLRVTIFVGSDDRELHARKLFRDDVKISVGFHKRLAADVDPTSEDANAEIDALLELVEAVADRFGPGYWGGAGWLKTEIAALPNADHLKDHRTFTAFINLTFRLIR